MRAHHRCANYGKRDTVPNQKRKLRGNQTKIWEQTMCKAWAETFEIAHDRIVDFDLLRMLDGRARRKTFHITC